MPGVEIKTRENGPYKVTGPIRLIDADGNEFELPDAGKPIVLCRCGGAKTKPCCAKNPPDDGTPIVLCRCGGSKPKPFCDKTHSEIGFKAAERAVAEADER